MVGAAPRRRGVSTPKWAMLAAIGLYALSLPLPAIQGTGFPAQSGFDVLMQGAGAWRDGVFAWYANPLLGMALVLGLAGRFRSALALAVVGLMFGLSSFAAGPVAERAGRSIPPFGFGPGFYVWLGAFLLVIVAAAVGIYKVSRGPLPGQGRSGA